MTHRSEQVQTTTRSGHGRKLEGLWVDFVKLQRLRRDIILDLGIAPGRGVAADVDREPTDRMFASIDDELERIACEAAALEANSHVDMEYKAIMLAEYLPPNRSALHVALAWSLIEDIKLRSGGSASGAGAPSF
ncbi:MAG: hypothetical protein ACR2PI_16610 [Hyphomicrobiaceae bacterium]